VQQAALGEALPAGEGAKGIHAMNKPSIGILHPGEMGVSIAAAAQSGGAHVLWTSQGRSPATRARAVAHHLEDVITLEQLCAQTEVILSVCPPHAAEQQAHAVLAAGFHGLYVDANAIAPQRARAIAQTCQAGGADFVDGGIIGGPAWTPGRTWLYLSGARAGEVQTLFAASPLATHVLGDQPGQASALKMCFAAFTKGSTALLCAVLASAEKLGVRADLEHQWALEDETFPVQAAQRVRGVTAKAWRFTGEMDEIAATFRSAGLPGEFHAAAAEIYRRIAGYQGAPELPALEDVLTALRSDSAI
jgi:3-hydroxyisobutyrate dehydrogenase-like beta-hydroxyacid dehydrogenase